VNTTHTCNKTNSEQHRKIQETKQTVKATRSESKEKRPSAHLDARVRVEVEVEAARERDAAIDARTRPHVALAVVADLVVAREEARAVALEHRDVRDRRRVAALEREARLADRGILLCEHL
jgi:YbbR domain-containing protein